MKLTKSLNRQGHRKCAPWFWFSGRLGVIASLLTVLSVQDAVHAAFTQYSDPSSFAAALQSGSYLNDFTGAGSAASLSYVGPDQTTGPFAYMITASTGGITGVPMVAASGLGTSLSTFAVNAVLTITFTGATKPTAIGGNYFWSDLSSPANVANGTVRADFKIGGSTVYTMDVSSTGNSSIGYGGVTTDGVAFDSLTLTLLDYTSGNFFPTFDNFQVGQVTPVPEPGSWVLAGFLGLLLFVFKRRKVPTAAA